MIAIVPMQDHEMAARHLGCLGLTMVKYRTVSLDAGFYFFEGDINEQNFQQADPHGLLYAPTGVGFEDWYVTG